MDMLRCLLSAAMLLSTPAAAQQWTMGDQGVNWNVLSTKPTGAAPADAFEPADIPLPAGVVESDWIVETGDQIAGDFLKLSTDEKKIRVHCEPSNILTQDNILGKGLKKFMHGHQGFGLIGWDGNTTFATARTNPRSSCSGGPLNATNYMEPALLKKQANGAIVSIRAQDQANYYVEGQQSEPNTATWIRAGFQFILGANASDFNDQYRRDVYAAAGFLYPGSPDTPAGMLGFICGRDKGATQVNAVGEHRLKNSLGGYLNDRARYLRGPNGEDPFGGQCYGTINNPAVITSHLIAQGCWDRHNFTSPNGRGHLWYAASKADSSVVRACPTTTAGESYGRVPELEVKNNYDTTGFADYGQWHFGSDRKNPANTPGDPSSLDPCRKISAWFCNGATLHADYTYGWKRSVFDGMQRECLGIPVRGIAPVHGPASCNNSQINRYQALLDGGASPNPAWSGCAVMLHCTNATIGQRDRFAVVPDMKQGAVTIHHGPH